MEDFYNNTSQNHSFYEYYHNYDYYPYDPYNDYFGHYDYYDYYDYNNNNNTINVPISKLRDALYVGTWIIICLGLPLTLMAISSLLSLVRNDHVAPIYVINLLISDIVQFCCLIQKVAELEDKEMNKIFFLIYNCSVKTSVVFMVCIALERYLLIVHPMWYRFRRNIKTSVVVCVLVWVLTATLQFFTVYFYNYYFTKIFQNVTFLLPFPLLIFFLGATLKTLSASISVPSDEKRRIVGMLVVVLLIYTLLFLPHIIYLNIRRHSSHFRILSTMFLRFSPLADLVMYIVLMKGIVHNPCFRRIQHNDISVSVITITTGRQSVSGKQ